MGKKWPKYPSFVGELSMLDLNYLNTLFFTKNLNKAGFYEYFVRRNGEYYVEFCDDLFPVDAVT